MLAVELKSGKKLLDSSDTGMRILVTQGLKLDYTKKLPNINTKRINYKTFPLFNKEMKQIYQSIE
jgi:hypothetical protein